MSRSNSRPFPFVVLTALAGLAPGAPAADGAAIVKSANDQRDYAAFVLDNRMRVVVVSDPDTEDAAAALDVNVGSGSDPRDRQGLAHFLEHMLFLGTEKYPQPGEYHRFIREHGGSNNAYTSYDHTNYFFDVQADQLEPALDRFSQFFVAPLFNPPYVSRERQVVHSEFVSKKRSDGRRAHHAFKQVINPEHPYAKFQVGSAETLADREGSDVREELIRFYRAHYSANLMTLVVLGREPVETLERWVRERFAAVPDRDVAPLEAEAPLFAPGRLPLRLDVEPVRDMQRVELRFPVPPVRDAYRSKPLSYIAHLLGHEGPGSLLSFLKARGWADALSAGVGIDHPGQATFDVSINLTPDGLESVDTVVGHVFEYLRLVEADGVRRWIWDEVARLSEIRFRYQEESSPMRHAMGLASSLHYYPVRDALRGPYAHDEFDPRAIRSYLARLRPGNALVTVTAKGVATDRVAPRYDVPYAVAGIPEETYVSWSVSETGPTDALALPEPNPFIPSALELVEGPGAPAPRRVVERPGFDLWHRTDVSFDVPRASFYFSVRSPIVNDSARHAVLTELLVRYANDALDEFSYPASLAGLDYRLYKHVRGISVRIGGWSDKQDVFARRIANTLRDPDIDADRFARIKDELVRELGNASERAPHRRAASEIRELLIEPSWRESEQLDALRPLAAEDLREFARRVFERVEVVALVHGNRTEAEARALGDLVAGAFVDDAKAVDVEHARVVKLEPGARFVREIASEHDDAAIAVYFQGEDRSDASRARAALLAQVVSQPFFDDLRTERELGYVVYATTMTILEVPGVAFLVQSPSADPAALEGHVEGFLARFAEHLESLGAEEFERHREALLSKLLEEDRQLGDRTDRYWTEIDREDYEFDLRERLAEAIRAIDLAGFRDYYRRLLLERGAARRVAVHVPGAASRAAPGGEAPEPDDATVIRDAAAFKVDRPHFED